MSLHDPQTTLARLHAACDQAKANLVELEIDGGRQLLDATRLQGESAVRWSRATADLTELWRLHGLLEAFLARADAVAKRRHDDELEALLGDATIELGSADTPLAQRHLLASAQAAEVCSADELLGRMSGLFDEAKTVIAEIGAVWDALNPQADAARVQLGECERLAAETGETGGTELTTAAEALGRVATRLTSDPMSVDADELAVISAVLTRIHASLERAAAVKRGFAGEVLAARGRLVELEAAVASAAADRERLLSRIASPSGPPAPQLDASLEADLAEIDAAARAGGWSRAGEMLARFTARVTSQLEEVRRVAELSRAPIAARDQLRALLDAYQAKAGALGMIEDADLVAAHTRAHDVLYTAPTDLALAAQLVRAYQQILNGAPEAPR